MNCIYFSYILLAKLCIYLREWGLLTNRLISIANVELSIAGNWNGLVSENAQTI